MIASMESKTKKPAKRNVKTPAKPRKIKRVPSAIPGYRNVELVPDPFGTGI